MLDNIPTPEPAQDRNVFERRLKEMICWKNEYSAQEAIEALLADDAVKIAAINAARQRCKQQIDTFLAEWDNAADLNARRQVCGKPKKNRRNN